MLVHSRYCQSGVASTNYAVVCKVTDISAPVLSILVNVSVMLLTIWQAWYVIIFCLQIGPAFNLIFRKGLYGKC